MSPRLRSRVRAAVIAAGTAVGIAAVVSARAADWPIYAIYFVLSAVLFLPGLEILPRIRFAIAEMAATIGFVYIGGLPIIVLHWFTPVVTRQLLHLLPAAWRARLRPYSPHRDLFFDAWIAGGPIRIGMIAEWANFSLGLAVRLWVARIVFSTAPPIADAGVILVAEFAGYATWGLLSQLPIYPHSALVPEVAELGGMRSAFSDVTLIVVLALTPFVFLITYGYELHGLAGAAGWSVGTLGLHAMLVRLHERRLRVEDQNRRLAALNRELEHRERLSAIGKMSSVVSHQILQQLGVIGIYADLIRHAEADGNPEQALAEAREKASAIEGALGDVNRVLTDLLVFSRDLRLNLYVHPLSSIVAEVAAECAPEASERGVVLRTEVADPVEPTVDKLKLKQALLNVVRNAIQASPKSGEVVIAATREGSDVVFSVSDQGGGVPERDREAVFAPFFTTKEQGSGLGLAIARVFVEAHGGRIWVEPGQGKGTVFRIRLPIDGPAASATPAAL